MAITAEELPPPTIQTTSPGKRVLEVMEGNIPDGDWTITDVVERTLAYLEEFEPHVIRVWLREQGSNTLGEFLRHKQSSARTKWRRGAAGRAFGESAKAFEKDGQSSHLSVFDLTYTVTDDNIRRKMGDMTGADHLYVAQSYTASAAKQKMLAAFHKKVAEIVGDARTADVINETDLEEMYRSISE